MLIPQINLKQMMLILIIYVYVFFTPIMVVSTPVGFLGVPEMIFFFGLIVLLNLNKIRLSPPSILYFIFLLYFSAVNILVASIRSVSDDLFLFLRLFASFLPFLLLDQRDFYNDKNVLLFKKLFLTSLCMAVIAGLVMFVFGVELREGQQRIWYDGGSTIRAGGLTGNSAGFGFLCALFISFVWIDRAISQKRFNILVFYSLIFLGMVGVIFSSSRAGFLFLVVMFVVLLIINIFTLDRSSILGFFKVFLVFSLVALLLFISLNEGNDLSEFILQSIVRLDVLNISGQDSFLKTVRFSTWPIIISELESNLWFGLGYKQFYYHSKEHSDNSFIGIAIDGGVFSLILYVAFWSVCLGDAIFKTLTIDLFYKYLIAFLMGGLAFSMTVDFYSMWYPGSLFFMAYGIIRLSLHHKLKLRKDEYFAYLCKS